MVHNLDKLNTVRSLQEEVKSKKIIQIFII